MKRIFSIILACATVTGLFAQDATTTTSTTEEQPLKSKRGYTILPETDEWALGVSADPFFDFMGNIFNGTQDQSSPSFDFASNPANRIAIFGKMMKDENTAYRIRFNVSVGTSTEKAVVTQDLINANPQFPAFTEDWEKNKQTTIVIAPGYEFRRGKSRVQGIYGGELVLALQSTKTEYQYGNSINVDFQAPTRNDFGPNDLGGGAWITEIKSGTNFLVGVRGFIGVEYFIAPKISIGGEFGYMFAYQNQAKGHVKSEVLNGVLNGVQVTTTDTYPSFAPSSIGVGLDNLNGSINLLFYF